MSETMTQSNSQPRSFVFDCVQEEYKRTDVGVVIPANWDCDLLGNLATRVGSGITPTGGERVYVTEGRPFLRSQNVGLGVLILEDLAFITDEIHTSFAGSQIKEGDVLLNITGASIGRSAVADTTVALGNVNQHVCEIRPDQKRLDSHFLNSYLLSAAGQKQIDSFQAGGNRQGLNYSQIRSFLIPCPPLPEQRAIAEALSDVDGFVRALEKVIDKKRAIKQAAMQQLLNGRTRLQGFSGAWEKRRLGEIAVLHRQNVVPATFGDTLFMHFSLPAFDEGQFPITEPGSEIGSNKFRIPTKAVLVSRLNPRIPRVWAPTSVGDNAIASTEFLVLTPTEEISYGFLHAVCASPGFCEQMELLSTGTTGSHQRISPPDAMKIGVWLPISKKEQRAIANFLSDMDSEIAALEERRDKAHVIKQGMMQVLLTGRVRLVKSELASKQEGSTVESDQEGAEA